MPYEFNFVQICIFFWYLLGDRMLTLTLQHVELNVQLDEDTAGYGCQQMDIRHGQDNNVQCPPQHLQAIYTYMSYTICISFIINIISVILLTFQNWILAMTGDSQVV